MRFLLALLSSSLISGCLAEPDSLPTQVHVAGVNKQIDRTEEPPLYQMLYDYAFLPEVQHAEQRVRILIWLNRLGLSDYQLAKLKELASWVEVERQRIETLQSDIVKSYEPRLLQIYSELWDGLRAGLALDDPLLQERAGTPTERSPAGTVAPKISLEDPENPDVEISEALLEESAQKLLVQKLQSAREKELFEVRIQGVNAVLDKSREWLTTLKPQQEIPLTDSVFFLRHRLDPYANPGDFEALVGRIYIRGVWGTLTRGTEGFDPGRDHLNLGGLWSESSLDDLDGPVFNDARREILLYMILLEPALPEAVDAARYALAQRGNQSAPQRGPGE